MASYYRGKQGGQTKHGIDLTQFAWWGRRGRGRSTIPKKAWHQLWTAHKMSLIFLLGLICLLVFSECTSFGRIQGLTATGTDLASWFPSHNHWKTSLIQSFFGEPLQAKCQQNKFLFLISSTHFLHVTYLLITQPFYRPYGWIWLADLILVLMADGAFPIWFGPDGLTELIDACGRMEGGIIPAGPGTGGIMPFSPLPMPIALTNVCVSVMLLVCWMPDRVDDSTSHSSRALLTESKTCETTFVYWATCLIAVSANKLFA